MYMRQSLSKYSWLRNYGLLSSRNRFYHDRVLDHYNNPRNVGSLDKNDTDVGTGLVGAPACIHGDTLIATADGTRYMKIKDIYDKGKDTPVWSYNIKNEKCEIKLARAIKTAKKTMVKITFDNNSLLICTEEHKVLDRLTKEYVEIVKMMDKSIFPFKRSTAKRGYWDIRNLGNDYNHKIVNIEYLEGTYDCYDLQVEENNNFAIITKITKNTKNIQSGIILKNCGDVMRLQIRVKDGIIEDAKFKTFGCGSAIASSSLVTEWIKGQNITNANKVKNNHIAKHLSLPPVKLHCSMLAEDAVKAAIDDYKRKQNIEKHQ